MEINYGQKWKNFKNRRSYDRRGRGRSQILWCSLMLFFNSRARSMQIGCTFFFHIVEEGLRRRHRRHRGEGRKEGGREGGGRPFPFPPPFVAFGSSVRHYDSATFARRAAKLMHYSRGREGGREEGREGARGAYLPPPVEWVHLDTLLALLCHHSFFRPCVLLYGTSFLPQQPFCLLACTISERADDVCSKQV